jgi:hypothetical protein
VYLPGHRLCATQRWVKFFFPQIFAHLKPFTTFAGNCHVPLNRATMNVLTNLSPTKRNRFRIPKIKWTGSSASLPGNSASSPKSSASSPRVSASSPKSSASSPRVSASSPRHSASLPRHSASSPRVSASSPKSSASSPRVSASSPRSWEMWKNVVCGQCVCIY